MVGPDGAALPRRTPRISPRRLKSVLRCSIGRPGSLAPLGFSAVLAPGLGRKWMNPTLSPTLGPDGGGGGGGGASTTGAGLVSGGNSLVRMGGLPALHLPLANAVLPSRQHRVGQREMQ